MMSRPITGKTDISLPGYNKKSGPLAESHEGNAPQKTCAYGAQEAKLAGQKCSDLTGTSCSTATKREARRTLTSEFGLNGASSAGVAAPAANADLDNYGKQQRELSLKRNECAFAIVGMAKVIVNKIDDHVLRQCLRELIEQYTAADKQLDAFYSKWEEK